MTNRRYVGRLTAHSLFLWGRSVRIRDTLSMSLLVAFLGACAGETKQETATDDTRNVEMGKELPRVVISTSLGDIAVDLYPDEAPVTVANFLGYVDSEFFDGTIFHRVMPGFMIQGGGFSPDMAQKTTGDPIVNEADNGLNNDRGTLAMARHDAINSATAQFFINVVDNVSLNHVGQDKFGYAVFGRVVEGMEVVDRIVAVPRSTAGRFENVPVEPVIILSLRRDSGAGIADGE